MEVKSLNIPDTHYVNIIEKLLQSLIINYVLTRTNYSRIKRIIF